MITASLQSPGLIITISLLCAAGLAIYENPQVRQWIDESRRKAAVALHSLGDELAPQSESRNASPDASTREDEDPEAVERRRRARQEILERGRMMEERRRSKQAAKGKAKSFDDLVDKDGALKVEETTATSSAAEVQSEEPGLRHRHTEFRAAALGSAYADPFADEMGVPIIDASPSPQEQKPDPISRSSTPTQTVSASPLTLRDFSVSPPVPPKPAAYQPQRLLIDTDEVSNHPSEQLLDLTPTTSASSAAADLAELNVDPKPSRSNYWAVNEWAQNSAPAFYSPPQSEAAGGIEERMESHTDGSHAGTGEHASQLGTEDMDVMSDDEAGVSTPGSWTEVGSQVSEDY
ncbi:hypothetical protein IMSHALPRED_010643 [Imshaugia aleurites]|uniref:Uncharacterized protein n=1 Tax=Imshaugia aleurites TaxID=172621 RepID=A0A8H3IFP1_9LECA|nr:hypothetical protein IMSHALPRED_010643 [Imshaugia aleurites]